MSIHLHLFELCQRVIGRGFPSAILIFFHSFIANIINEMPQLLQIKTVYLNSRVTSSGNIGERTLTSGQTEKVNLWSKIKMVHPWIRQCAIPHCHDPLPINIIPWERPYQYTSSYWVSTYLGGCVLTFLLSSAADIHSSLDLLTFSGTMARERERERKRERERERYKAAERTCRMRQLTNAPFDFFHLSTWSGN